MDHLCAEVLREKRESIVSSADPHRVLLGRLLDHLTMKRSINEDHIEHIHSGITSRDRFGRLLDFVSAEGRTAFNDLCDAFRGFNTHGKSELADELQSALGMCMFMTCECLNSVCLETWLKYMSSLLAGIFILIFSAMVCVCSSFFSSVNSVSCMNSISNTTPTDIQAGHAFDDRHNHAVSKNSTRRQGDWDSIWEVWVDLTSANLYLSLLDIIEVSLLRKSPLRPSWWFMSYCQLSSFQDRSLLSNSRSEKKKVHSLKVELHWI